MAFFNEIKCRRCDRKYSSIRSRCPYCGARKNRDGKDSAADGNKQNNKLQLIVGLIVLIIIILAVIILVSASLKNRDPEPDNTPPANTGVVSVDNPEETPTEEPTDEPVPSTDPPVTQTPAPVVNSIALNREDFTMFTIGETFQMTATLTPAGTEAEIIWISEDSKVVTVDDTGLVTAVDRGNTIVSATAGGITAECIVRVRADAPKTPDGDSASSSSGDIKLSSSDVTIHYSSSESFVLSVSGTDATPTYSVDNSCVTVDSSGRVTAVSGGTAVVSVTVNDDSGSPVTLKCIVRVIA